MTSISVSDVQKLAQLSALEVTDEGAALLANELSHILGYVELLESVDTEGIEPTYQVGGLHTVTRPDEIIDYGISQEDLLKNAPKVNGSHFEVPRVFE